MWEEFLGEELTDEILTVHNSHSNNTEDTLRAIKKAKNTRNTSVAREININFCNISEVIEQKAKAAQSLTDPIYNKMFPQLKIDRKITWRLTKLSDDNWILNPLETDISPKVPQGRLSYVILYEDPGSIYCFEHDTIIESEEMKALVTGPINYGHSSLAFIEDQNSAAIFNKGLPLQDRLKRAAKPVLLAGHVNFPNEENPLLGAGTMSSWTLESGHYRPSVSHAVNNRIGHVQKILPMEKFIDVIGGIASKL